MESKDIELLKFNYRNLHESVWDAHRTAWTVTSIFIPVLFTIQGYLIKEFDKLLTFQVIVVTVIAEIFMFIWWLIMRMLRHYNDVRIERLREIEQIIDNQLNNNRLFRQYSLNYKQIPKKLKISPKNIYRIILLVYTIFWYIQ